MEYKLNQLFHLVVLGSLALFFGCEDDKADNDTLVVESFSIVKVDVESTGDPDQSQPELVRFVSDTEGVIVNSKQNTVDFIPISSTDLSMSGESVQITDDPDAECSSIDVSVDESILAVVVSKGACDRGLLYLIDAATKNKF